MALQLNPFTNIKWSRWVCLVSVCSAGVLVLSPQAVVRRVKSIMTDGAFITQTTNDHLAICGSQQNRHIARRQEELRLAKEERQRRENQASSSFEPSETATLLTTADYDESRKNNLGFTFSQALELETYKTVTAEIKERISQEHVLAAFKFTIIGAILWFIFSLVRQASYETLFRQRRTALFFSAAIIVSALIDFSIRFDLKMIENLGDWVWCFENKNHTGLLWEHFLPMKLDMAWYPVVRGGSLLFTPLLYGVTLYLFLLLPDGADRRTVNVIQTSTIALFAALFFVAGPCEGAFAEHQSGIMKRVGPYILPGLLTVIGIAAFVLARRMRLKESKTIGQREGASLRAFSDVSIVDELLDRWVMRFAANLKDKHQSLIREYFGNRAPPRITRLGLEPEISRVTPWISSLKATSDETLRALGAELEDIVAMGEAALGRRHASKQP